MSRVETFVSFYSNIISLCILLQGITIHLAQGLTATDMPHNPS